jgi:hypothetical protein
VRAAMAPTTSVAASARAQRTRITSPYRGVRSCADYRLSASRALFAIAVLADAIGKLLNETLFTSLMQARLALQEWQRDYEKDP